MLLAFTSRCEHRISICLITISLKLTYDSSKNYAIVTEPRKIVCHVKSSMPYTLNNQENKFTLHRKPHKDRKKPHDEKNCAIKRWTRCALNCVHLFLLSLYVVTLTKHDLCPFVVKFTRVHWIYSSWGLTLSLTGSYNSYLGALRKTHS